MSTPPPLFTPRTSARETKRPAMVSTGEPCKLPTIDRLAGDRAARTWPASSPASRAAALHASDCLSRARETGGEGRERERDIHKDRQTNKGRRQDRKKSDKELVDNTLLTHQTITEACPQANVSIHSTIPFSSRPERLLGRANNDHKQKARRRRYSTKATHTGRPRERPMSPLTLTVFV